MSTLKNILKQALQPYQGQPLWLAVSGGMDSMVMWDLLQNMSKEIVLAGVIHIDHGLSEASSEWARFIERKAKQAKIPCVIKQIKIVGRTHIEEKARIARYQAMSESLPPGVTVICAHHYNDQCETFLFRALRGSGIHGLVGMKPLSEQFSLRVLRPFLGVKKSVISDYAKTFAVEHIHDSSNDDMRFDRNQIRQRCSDLIERKALSVTIENLQRQSRLLQKCVQDRLEGIQLSDCCIDVSALSVMDPDWQREVLHHWIYECTQQRLSLSQVEAVLSMIDARQDANPVFSYQDVCVRRYRHILTTYQPMLCMDAFQSDATSIDLGASGVIKNPKALMLHISFGPHQSGLKKKFQAMCIPAWLRKLVPLIEYEGLQLLGNKGDQSLQTLVKWHPSPDWAPFLSADSQWSR